MAYQVGDKVNFKITEVKKSGRNLYFVIHPDGYDQDVKAFEFQRGKTLPFNLECYCRAVKDTGEPVFYQDIAKVIEQLYRVGESYDFRVKNDAATGGYYEVVDSNGLVMRLTDYGRARLHVNQVVKCQVKSINLVRVELKLISEGVERGMPFFDFDRVMELADAADDSAKLKYFFSHTPFFAEAFRQYEAENPLWIMTAIEAADRYLSDWIGSRHIDKSRALYQLNQLCIGLLEQSNYLSNCTERDGFDYQEKFSRYITHFQDFAEAVELVESRRDMSYIADVLERLKRTGYLYQPEKRMRVAMAIFSMQRKKVNHFIADILDIIRHSHDKRRFMHLFSKAFIELLDAYIVNEAKVTDTFTPGMDRELLNQMITALTIRLLLGKDLYDDTATDYLLYHSMLYRYATLIADSRHEVLLKKARQALLGFIPDKLEFTWDDIPNINFLCNKLSFNPSMATSEEARIFEGNNAMATIDGQMITLMPLQRGYNLNEVMGKEAFAGHDIRILLNDKLSEKGVIEKGDIRQFHRIWNEIEQSLLAPNQGTVPQSGPKVRQAPLVGDVVSIRITKQSFNDKFCYQCKIEDDKFEGEGTLHMRQVVKYNIRPLTKDFYDPASGRPYLLRAKVIERTPDGKFRFSLLEPLATFLKENLELDSVVMGEVIKADAHYCFAISEEGYSLYIPLNEVRESVRFGDRVEVRIDDVNPDGNVKAYFVRKVNNELFQQHDAFVTLIREYSAGRTYFPMVSFVNQVDLSADTKSSDTFLEPDNMREMVHVIDRLAMLNPDHIVTYNLLAVARILSRMLSDDIAVEYFSKRMSLVEAIYLYGMNDTIDPVELDKLLKENQDFMKIYPDIKNKMLQLKAVSLLGKEHDWDFLYQAATDTDSPEASRDIARYVLSYNMLQNANQHDALKAIRRKIYQTMEIRKRVPKTSFVAHEDQYTELKTSLFFPPDRASHMQASEKLQTAKIMKVVASMLNASGGRLYIGVNDQGNAIGLHNDFTYLNLRHQDYDLVAMKDKFDRRFRDAVHNQLGREANARVDGSFETLDSMVIYRVDITPSPEVIYLEGVAYERQGTSAWPVPEGALPQFVDKRRQIED